MTLKFWPMWRTLVLSYLACCQTSTAGVISLESESQHHHHHHQNDHQSSVHHQYDPHVSVASSFMHFHGPVEGPEFEVKVPYVVHHTSEHNHLLHDGGQDHNGGAEEEEHHSLHHDHGYTVDYVAHPKYQFSYGVEDYHTGDFHGQKEIRDGSSVSGEYSVKEPGGSVRVVSYRADKDGFHAVVHTSGKNDHSGATYSPDAHHEHQGHHHAHQQLQIHAQGHDHVHQQQLQVHDQGHDHVNQQHLEIRDQGHDHVHQQHIEIHDHGHDHVHQQLQTHEQEHHEEPLGGDELHEYAAGYGNHEGYN